MPCPTLSLLRRLTLLLTMALLLASAGCQSSRTAFRFRPAAPATASASTESELINSPGAAAGSLAPKINPPPKAVLAAPPGAESVVTAAKSPAPQRRGPSRAAPRGTALLAPTFPAPQRFLARNGVGRLARQLTARSHPAPAGVAESGLGTTFLGVLGIVALVVGLVGLLFAGWGFFGWLAVGGAVLLLISILAPYFGW